jgi:MOSC domain-containing protein YiiM
MAEHAMVALPASHQRHGFHFRVLQEGEVGAGDEIVKVAAGPERITRGKPSCAAVFTKALALTT